VVYRVSLLPSLPPSLSFAFFLSLSYGLAVACVVGLSGVFKRLLATYRFVKKVIGIILFYPFFFWPGIEAIGITMV
jgi:hypothetical protein